MRLELASLRLQTRANERRFDLPRQTIERRAGRHPGPKRTDAPAVPEVAHALEHDLETRCAHGAKRQPDILEGGAIDFADEAQSQVYLLWIDPAGARNAGAQAAQPRPHLRR